MDKGIGEMPGLLRAFVADNVFGLSALRKLAVGHEPRACHFDRREKSKDRFLITFGMTE